MVKNSETLLSEFSEVCILDKADVALVTEGVSDSPRPNPILAC